VSPAAEGIHVAEQRRLYVGGAWSVPSTDQVIEVISPHSEAVIATELGREGFEACLDIKSISIAAPQ
jgi:hypothetical protein